MRPLFLIVAVLSLLLVVAVCVAADVSEGLVAHYTFDELTANAEKDGSGNGNDARVRANRWVRAGMGSSISLERTGSYIDLGNNPNLKIAGDMSIAAWIKLEAMPYPNTQTNWYILNCERYNQSGFGLRVDGTSGLLYYRSNQPGTSQGFFSDVPLGNNVFRHVLLVKRQDQASIFLDGRLVGQGSVRDPGPGDSHLTIGDPSQSFEGLVDDFRIYRRALSVNDIAALYKQGAAAHEKDTYYFGKFLLRPFIYYPEKRALLEVDFRGILPVESGDRISVELGRPGGRALQAKQVDSIPDSGRGDFEFSLNDLTKGAYELRAILTHNGKVKAEKRIPFHYPPLPVSVVQPQQKVVASLPRSPGLADYGVEVCPGGGIRVRFRGLSYLIESTYSYPHGGDNRLTADRDASGEAEWRVSAEPKAYRATAKGKFYSISREVKPEPGRILVKDTISNTGTEDVGIIFNNRINTGEYTDIRPYPIHHLIPMMFLQGGQHGIGMVALDDVYILQMDKRDGGLGSSKFGLAPGKSYTLEWAVYPRATPDYWGFVNAVRHDQGLDRHTIDGCYSVTHSGRWLREIPPRDLVENAGLKYISSGCVTKIEDDPQIAIEGFEFLRYPMVRQALKQNYAEIKKEYPGLKVMFHVAPHLQATNRSAELYPDSLMLDKFGKHSLYDDAVGYFSQARVDEGWAYYPFYPTRENSFGKDMLRSVDVMMDDIGTDGVFADGLISGYGAKGSFDNFTYDTWDGYSVQIDPSSKTITRKMGSIYLLGRDLISDYIQRINDKGGQVIVNEMYLFPRSFTSRSVFTNAETNDGDFRCGQMHLAPIPIGLAQPNKSANELDIYNDIRSKLEWGALYAYYQWSCTFTHRMITAEMYPITIQELHSGYIKGKERLITLHSGVYGWPGSSDLHLVYLADARGAQALCRFLTTVDKSGVRTRIDLNEGETAVLKRIPVSVSSASPVNLVCEKYDSSGMRMTLNGRGAATISVRSGDFRVEPGKAYLLTMGRTTKVKSDRNGRLSIPIRLSGRMQVSITKS